MSQPCLRSLKGSKHTLFSPLLWLIVSTHQHSASMSVLREGRSELPHTGQDTMYSFRMLGFLLNTCSAAVTECCSTLWRESELHEHTKVVSVFQMWHRLLDLLNHHNRKQHKSEATQSLMVEMTERR
jgi:hypothetical protein